MKAFKHYTNARDTDQMFELIEECGVEGYGVWWVVAENLYEGNGARIKASDILEDLIDLFGCEETFIQKCLDTFALVKLIDRSDYQDGFVFSAAIEQECSEVRSTEYTKHRGLVLRRDGFRCVYCGCENDLTLDHIIPQSRGGSDDPRNLVTACRPCNSSKNACTPEEWLGGKS